LPGALTGFYYMVLASPQYVVETQFSVRGSSQSSMSSFGLSGIFGTSVQNNDSYVVSSYIDSVQLIRDVKDQLGIDLRQYYSKNDVDFYYRIKPDMPLEKFTDYWRNMIAISFNSTTGNTTLYVYAFSADDSKAIADAVLKVSETLVNNLSESSRQQMTLMASKQVDRAEDRLRKVQEQTRTLRSEIKSVDLGTLTQQQQQLTQQLQNQLQQLKTRQATLLQSVSSESPTARSLQKQIKAAAASLAEQQKKLDGGKSDTVGDTTNVGAALNKFEELTVEQGFATQAYTSALAAFETALAEAQKQERYFATFIAPTRPEIALYPLRMLDSFIAFLVFLAVWMISQFLFRSFRDHAI
jgi:capsular polysaccharide transport system permease protein